jgi:hypothetical protein
LLLDALSYDGELGAMAIDETAFITADQVKIALGEAGDIWPESIRGDVDPAI